MEQQKRTYTVKDEVTGKTVTFDWHDAGDPTDADLEQVFAEAGGGQKPAQGKSVGGFLNNLATSAGDFVVDTVKGIPSLARGAIRIGRAGLGDPRAWQELRRDVPQVASGVKDYAVDRYGSVNKALDTLYTDPVGALADVSTIASGGSAAPGRAGRIMSRVERATNPMQAMRPIATATEVGAAATVRPALNPSKRLRAQQRGPLEIERTAIRGGIVTRGQARGRSGAAANETTQRAQAATDAGVTVPRSDVARFPETLDRVENMTPNIRPLDELAGLETETMQTLSPRLTPAELLRRRRSLDSDLDGAFRRADQPGGQPIGIREEAQQELVGNIREQLRQVAPEVRASDDTARRFGMVSTALGDAANRPSRLTTMAAGGGAGAFLMSGNQVGAVVSTLLGAGLQFPQIALALGIPPAALTRMLAAEKAQRAAVLARLAGQR